MLDCFATLAMTKTGRCGVSPLGGVDEKLCFEA